MKITAIAALLGVALITSACQAPALVMLGPAEAVVARVAGYPSYYEQGLDEGCEAIGGTLPRDPVTGNC